MSAASNLGSKPNPLRPLDRIEYNAPPPIHYAGAPSSIGRWFVLHGLEHDAAEQNRIAVEKQRLLQIAQLKRDAEEAEQKRKAAEEQVKRDAAAAEAAAQALIDQQIKEFQAADERAKKAAEEEEIDRFLRDFDDSQQKAAAAKLEAEEILKAELVRTSYVGDTHTQ